MPAAVEAEPQELTITADRDVVRVRQAMRTFCVAAKLTLVDQTKAITAASELARNTLVHGGGGVAVLELVEDGRRAGVRATFSDEGPGIPDVEQALGDGWSSGTGLGLGLSGSRRLVDAFDIRTAVGEGTTVTMTKWAR
jgi:serine/threonine-protein kinase RsbT